MRNLTSKFHIYFILDGKDYALRSWPAVPRIGERVMFHPTKEEVFTARVVDVCWGVEKYGRDDVPTINCFVERLP